MSRRRPPRSRQARARIALALCVLWIAGFELLPWAHIALHDHLAPHHHDATGAIILGAAPHDDDLDAQVDEHGTPIAHAASHDDDLDAEVDEHGAPIAPHHDDDLDADHDTEQATIGTRKPAIDAQARLAAALAHGEHSLAHHGIAVPVPAPVVTSPLPVDRRPTFVATIAIIAPISLTPGRAVARGPPIARA